MLKVLGSRPLCHYRRSYSIVTIVVVCGFILWYGTCNGGGCSITISDAKVIGDSQQMISDSNGIARLRYYIFRTLLCGVVIIFLLNCRVCLLI